jgi:ABC-2 type transport system permease protein
MNSTFEAAAAAAPSGEPSPAHAATGRTLLMLVRREFWENRYLWCAPLAVAVLIALSPLLGHGELHLPPFANADSRVALSTLVQWALLIPLSLVMVICVGYYLLDCLYTERRDRSILFWKSLPISDRLTVGSKVLVALLVVPLGVCALGVLAHVVFSALIDARLALRGVPAMLGFNLLEWFRTELALLLMMLLAMLWYAPLSAYLLLISAWARRSPFLWAALPLAVAPLLERIVFGSHYLWSFLKYRQNGIWHTLALGHTHIISHDRVLPVGTLLDDLNFREAFTDVDLWLGIAVAVALVLLAVRVRRYRDDS